jgi:hypothetical protein
VRTRASIEMRMCVLVAQLLTTRNGFLRAAVKFSARAFLCHTSEAARGSTAG